MIALLICLFGTVGAASKKSATVTLMQGIPCQGKVRLYSDGKIKSCCLAAADSVSGYYLPAGSRLSFRPSGTLSDCVLGGDASFYGQSLPAETEVCFKRDGQFSCFWPPDDTMIQGHLVQPHIGGVGNKLYPNSTLRAFWLARDEVIDGVPCSSSNSVLKYGLRVITMGTNRMVYLYDDGHLRQAMLSRDCDIGGYPYDKGDVVRFAPDGKPDRDAPLLDYFLE